MIFGPYFPVTYHVSTPLMSRTARNYILRFFLDLPRKIAATTIFRTLRFPLLPCFFHLPEGASEFNKFCGEIAKIGAATTNFTLLFFVTFWFVSLTRRGFRIQQILRKWQKIGAATIFRSFFVFLTYQKALPNSTNSVKILKSRGRNDFSHFVVLTYQRELPN